MSKDGKRVDVLQPKSIKLTKINVAKRLLEKSILFFFTNDDVVVIHLLIHSALDILNDLAHKKGLKTINDEFMELIKPEYRKTVTDQFREPGNYFKHAGGSFKEPFEFFYSSSEYFIWMACEMFVLITKDITPYIKTFRYWFYTKHHDILLKEEDKKMFKTIAEKLDFNNKIMYIDVLKYFVNNEYKICN